MILSNTSYKKKKSVSESERNSHFHLLALVTEAFGGYGGIAKFNRDLFEALSSWSEVKILPRLAAHNDVIPEHISQLEPIKGRAHYAMKAMGEIRLARKGMIFCGHINLLPVAFAMKKMTNAPLWLQIHGIEAWKVSGPLIRFMLRLVDYVTSVSRITRDRFLTWAPVNSEKVEILTPSVDLNVFTSGPKSEELVRHWGLAGKKVLLTVGRLSSAERYKGHDRVIKALPAIAAQLPKVVYVIVGDGDDKPRLESLARECGVRDSVIFVGGVDNNCNGDRSFTLVDWYRTADVFVMPSTGEGFGIVFLEALACGLPVVAGNEDGSRDALSNGNLGTLINPKDQKQLANAVLAAFHETVRRDILEKFSKDHFRERVEQIVQKRRC